MVCLTGKKSTKACMLLLVAITSLIGMTNAYDMKDLENFMQQMENPQV